MQPVDYHAVSQDVYAYADSQAPLAALVKEALGVIDDAIECFGYVPISRCACPREQQVDSLQARITSP